MVKKRQDRRKHIPMRTCVACGQSDAKRSLARIVASAEAGLLVDLSGKQAGRGAYLCGNPACWTKVTEPGDGTVARALRQTVSDEAKAMLKTYWQTRVKPAVPDS